MHIWSSTIIIVKSVGVGSERGMRELRRKLRGGGAYRGVKNRPEKGVKPKTSSSKRHDTRTTDQGADNLVK